MIYGFIMVGDEFICAIASRNEYKILNVLI